MSESKELVISSGDQLLKATTRRKFLGVLGMGGAIVFLPSVFTACSNDDSITGTDPNIAAFKLDLSNDTGILNYAYALEQLEAAYYTAALGSAGFALNGVEQQRTKPNVGSLRHPQPFVIGNCRCDDVGDGISGT